MGRKKKKRKHQQVMSVYILCTDTCFSAHSSNTYLTPNLSTEIFVCLHSKHLIIVAYMLPLEMWQPWDQSVGDCISVLFYVFIFLPQSTETVEQLIENQRKDAITETDVLSEDQYRLQAHTLESMLLRMEQIQVSFAVQDNIGKKRP